MSTRLSAGCVPAIYEFIKVHEHQFSVEMMCRLLEVTRSGYYEWLKNAMSKRAQEDAKLLRLDLREAGETCSKHRVARLMRLNDLRALHGYRIRR